MNRAPFTVKTVNKKRSAILGGGVCISQKCVSRVAHSPQTNKKLLK